MNAANQLGNGIRVVSMPCMERFERMNWEYRESILPSWCKKRVAIEAGVTGLWYKYVGLEGKVIGIERFGMSAPGDVVEIDVVDDVTAEAALTPSVAGAARLSLLSPDLVGGERFVVLRCADHGAGIAREHLPRLSERFYRVEGQKSGERLGTGLGLAIVKHIINRHRGGLAIESVEGQGTTFTAYLPRL